MFLHRVIVTQFEEKQNVIKFGLIIGHHLLPIYRKRQAKNSSLLALIFCPDERRGLNARQFFFEACPKVR